VHSIAFILISNFDSLGGSSSSFCADEFPQNIVLDRHQHNNPQRIQEFLVMHIVSRNIPSARGNDIFLCFRERLDELDETGHSSQPRPSGSFGTLQAIRDSIEASLQ
jgi:hypothetical protein